MKKLRYHNHIEKQPLKSKSLSKIPVSKDIHRKERDIILQWGILPSEKIQATSEMTEVMKNLSSSIFCVPFV